MAHSSGNDLRKKPVTIILEAIQNGATFSGLQS